jgi:hypothetical protein
MAEWMRKKYSYNQTKTDDGVEKTGSVSWWNDVPETTVQIGDDFQPVPGGPTLKVSSIDIQSEDTGKSLFGNPIRLWHISIAGDTSLTETAKIHYTFSINKDDKGIRQVSGTMAASNDGDAPVFTIGLGGKFTVPGVGELTCTSMSGGDELKKDGGTRWNVTYSGALVAVSTTPPDPDPLSTSNAFNGETARTIAGELVMLRRSTTPIKTGTITIYTNNDALVSTPGNTYSWGLVHDETVSHELIKQDGVIIGSYYRHDIRVEA